MFRAILALAAAALYRSGQRPLSPIPSARPPEDSAAPWSAARSAVRSAPLSAASSADIGNGMTGPQYYFFHRYYYPRHYYHRYAYYHRRYNHYYER